MPPMVAIGATICLPIFSVRDPLTFGIRLSFLLPPPRTLLGALARGLGITMEIESGDMLKGKYRVGDIMTYAFEESSFATAKPLSPIVKSTQTLRVIPTIEKAEAESAHDAFKHEIISMYRMKALYFIDLEELNSTLKESGLPEADLSLLVKASFLIDRVGNTECISHVEHASKIQVEAINYDEQKVDSCGPADWISKVEGEAQFGYLLPNLRMLRDLMDEDYEKRQVKKKGIALIRDTILRQKRLQYIFPLESREGKGGRVVFTPNEVKVTPRSGYAIHLFDDKSRVLLPKGSF